MGTMFMKEHNLIELPLLLPQELKCLMCKVNVLQLIPVLFVCLVIPGSHAFHVKCAFFFEGCGLYILTTKVVHEAG